MTGNSAAFATYPSLRGRPVVISGGASGIGEALVRHFAAQGAKVGFVDIAAEAGENLAEELTHSGHAVRFIACDVTDIAAYRAAIARFAEAHGEARVLVNNAAHDQRHDWAEVTPDEWDQRMAVNLKHAFFAMQAVAPGMARAGGGSIINFGSISWMIMTPSIPLYEIAKAAVHGLTRSMARELGRSAIRVNSLVPGAVITQRQLDLWITPEDLRDIEASQALSGHIDADDCARMALFLAADDSAMISGQHFLVDAGWANT
ncbi:SDR family NAD(P)-dependent oxidoreductase [Devosia faecipullorum]|uniref:SDR family NAD(P)-dependent oxidoreductase n=1 Tax=Devosia faecipullorum TaxID=2755039 RepID=UPI00187B7828|nr:SDR family oxidoreductase [Devosia faecipullorum]MBE7734166.1 SDR family oxidoreductase [Devosia faecipullorum]